MEALFHAVTQRSRLPQHVASSGTRELQIGSRYFWRGWPGNDFVISTYIPFARIPSYSQYICRGAWNGSLPLCQGKGKGIRWTHSVSSAAICKYFWTLHIIMWIYNWKNARKAWHHLSNFIISPLSPTPRTKNWQEKQLVVPSFLSLCAMAHFSLS